MSLQEIHYDCMRKKLQRMEKLGVLGLNSPCESAISGYGGFIPGKESENVCGLDWEHARDRAAKASKLNLQVADVAFEKSIRHLA